MSSNPPTPLGPTATAAVARLTDAMGEDGMPVAEAIDCLVAAAFEQASAEDILDELQLKGYLYEVDGRLYITPT